MRKILFLFATMLLSSIGLHAQTTIIPHPFTVRMEDEALNTRKVVYFSSTEPTQQTWKENYDDGQRLLTKDEWDCLLKTRSINDITAANFRGWAELKNEEGNVTAAYAVLLPDDWATAYDFDATNSAWKTTGTEPQNVFNIGSTFDDNTLNAADMTALQQAGAVFLPCEITAEEGTYAEGQYWTGTKDTEGMKGTYFVQFKTSSTTPSEASISITECGQASEERYVLWAQDQVTITLDESVNNEALLEPWKTSQQPVNVALVRSFTPGMYNTICLPFGLTADEVTTTFGSTTKLAKFKSGTLSEDKQSLNIVFEEVMAIEAGVPYLIQPENQVTNPTFNNRTIGSTKGEGDDFNTEESDKVVKYLGIINPHQLTAGNKRYLFLQANNTLTWSKVGDTSTMKGMRANFYVPQMADGETIPNGCPARLSVRPAPQGPTELGDKRQDTGDRAHKFMQAGKLFIEYNGVIYNIQGGREQ